MSLDGIRVNHAALDQAAQDMHRAVKEIDDRMDLLESELQPLRNDWSGSAQATYTQAKAAWDAAINEMKDLLDRSSRTVYESNAQYAATDKRGADYFAQ